jgi:hypothetical protein
MSDTPETDREEIVMGRTECDRYVLAEFARRLERERDKALMDRDDGDIATMTRSHYERILKERDEAIRQRNETNESSKYAVDYAIRERDEARESLRILAGLVAYGLGQSGEEWSLEAMRQATTAIQNAKSLEAAK